MAKRRNNSKPPVTIGVDGPLVRVLYRVFSEVADPLYVVIQEFASCLVTVFSCISKLIEAVTEAVIRRIRKWGRRSS
jgi:hypothetical protein